jgi:Rha family phage regulatory protein
MSSITKETNVFKLVPADAIIIQQADIRTTSLKVAEAFGRRHDDVLKRLNSMDCSADFHHRNFAEMMQKVTVGKGAVRDSKYYEMTKDGFMFLVMGFTGKQAAQIKEAYINAFNVMAAQLAERQRPSETITASEQQTLSEVVHKKAALHDNVGKALAEIWSRIHNKFRIAKYDQLQRTLLAEAIVYVSQLQLKAPMKPLETISKEQHSQLLAEMNRVGSNWVFINDSKLSQWVSNRIRTEFNVQTLQDLYATDFSKAMALLNQLQQDAHNFLQMVNKGKDYFIREVIGDGMPFTPWVARRMGGKDMLPNRPNWVSLANAMKTAI